MRPSYEKLDCCDIGSIREAGAKYVCKSRVHIRDRMRRLERTQFQTGWVSLMASLRILGAVSFTELMTRERKGAGLLDLGFLLYGGTTMTSDMVTGLLYASKSCGSLISVGVSEISSDETMSVEKRITKVKLIDD